MTHCCSVFLLTLNMWIADGILYRLNLNWSMHFRVGSRSPLAFKTKLYVTTVNNSFQPLAPSSMLVSGEFPPEEHCPLVRVGVWAKARVSFRVGGQPDNCPWEKLLSTSSGLGFWLKVSFGVGGQFSSWAIALEP